MERNRSVVSGEGKYSFEGLREKGRLLYEYVRGSTCYGLDLPTSDIDMGAVWVIEQDDLYGLPENYVEQVNDKRNDTTWYEIGKYVDLLCKANPTMLESLFVDDEFVKYCHPAFQILRDNRQMFVTKDTFNSFIGYAKSQIGKARGLNKKIVNEVTERLTPIDFCYCFNEGQGTVPIKKWLEERGLKQQYCGLNHMPNMYAMFGVFYDWGTHIRCEFKNKEGWNEFWAEHGVVSYDEKGQPMPNKALKFLHLLSKTYPDTSFYFQYETDEEWNGLLEVIQPKGYNGIQREDGTSTDIRLNSIVKGDKPINKLCYNKNAYEIHCREYKEYQEWVKMRNPQRYLENKGQAWDRKNGMHCMRLMKMGIEIAKTGKVNINRRGIDREELLNIRLGNTSYDDIMNQMKEREEEMKVAMANSTLPETVDRQKVNEILIKIRKEFENVDKKTEK